MQREELDRIVADLRVTAGHDLARVLALYPYLQEADVRQALAYAKGIG